MIEKKILLRLDAELYKSLKHAAIDRLMSVNGLLTETIKLHILKQGSRTDSRISGNNETPNL